MKIQLARLRDSLGLELIEEQEAAVLHIYKPNGLLFKVTVPTTVLEWFVDAHDDSGVIWSEWAEHYPIDGETREQLAAEMASELERFVTMLVASEVRVSGNKVIEFRASDVWERASLS
jgi:hypothetical protein